MLLKGLPDQLRADERCVRALGNEMLPSMLGLVDVTILHWWHLGLNPSKRSSHLGTSNPAVCRLCALCLAASMLRGCSPRLLVKLLIILSKNQRTPVLDHFQTIPTPACPMRCQSTGTRFAPCLKEESPCLSLLDLLRAGPHAKWHTDTATTLRRDPVQIH